MEEEYLRYLRENNKELYDQAISSANWSVKWRDEKITKLQSKFEQLKNRYERLADTTEMEQERSLQLQAEVKRLEEEFQRLCISFALSDDKNELYESFVESRGLEDEFLGFESLKENKNV